MVQIAYLILIFRRFAFLNERKTKSQFSNPVTVLICARNEEANLQRNLQQILEQDYCHFEVIVVNDLSTDGTQSVISELIGKYPNLKLVNLDRNEERKVRGKKHALTAGVKAASHAIILATDADCSPFSKYWIQEMVSSFNNEKTEIVLGYAPYAKTSGFLNQLIQYETFQTANNYFSFQTAGMPYMGVGRNIAFKKKFFLSQDWYAKGGQVPSGDDDIFVNQASNSINTEIIFSEDSKTVSEPSKTWNEWITQKTRHFQAGKYYKPYHLLLLSSHFLSNFLTYLLIPLVTFFSAWSITIVSMCVLKFSLQGIILRRSMKKLGVEELWRGFLIYDLTYSIILLYTNILTICRSPKWK